MTSLRLDASGPTLDLTVDVDPGSIKMHTVNLTFNAVEQVDFSGFNMQNVLFDIYVESLSEGG